MGTIMETQKKFTQFSCDERSALEFYLKGTDRFPIIALRNKNLREDVVHLHYRRRNSRVLNQKSSEQGQEL